MELWYWEDFPEGLSFEYGSYEMTEEEIITYAKEYDPQVMHTDPEGAKKTFAGGLCASGWHTSCVLMRMMYEGYLKKTASMGGAGVEENRWLEPVRPGEIMRVRHTILEARASKSKPKMGLVRWQTEMFNQHNDLKMTTIGTAMMERKNP